MCDADSQTGIHGFWPFSENPEVVCKNSELLTFRIPPCFRVSAEEGADSRKSADSATPPRLSWSVQLLRLITHPHTCTYLNVIKMQKLTHGVFFNCSFDVQHQNLNELQSTRAEFSVNLYTYKNSLLAENVFSSFCYCNCVHVTSIN